MTTPQREAAGFDGESKVGFEPQESALRPALQLFAAHNVDFADAYLAALSAGLGYSMATFDRDLGKLGAVVLV